MPSFRLRASVFVVDTDAFLRDLDKAVRSAYIAAGRAFLIAAGEIIEQHIWTGMLRGAFRNLEDVVGQLGASKAGYRIDRRRKGRKDNNPKRKGYYDNQLRTPELGRKYATPVDEIITKGRIVTGGAQNVTVFKFSVNISYYEKLDVGPYGRNPGTWLSFKAGSQAFEAELKRQMNNMPDINRYVTKKEIG